MTKDISSLWPDNLSAQQCKETWIKIMRKAPNHRDGIDVAGWYAAAQELGINEDQADQVLEWAMGDGLISRREHAGHIFLQGKGVTLLKESTI